MFAFIELHYTHTEFWQLLSILLYIACFRITYRIPLFQPCVIVD